MTNIDKFYHVESDGKKHLYFPTNFNESLSGVIIHEDVYCIFFGEHFNQPLDNVIWPQKLISLYFGFDFNQALDNVKFPSSLLTLSIVGLFNQPLDNVKILDTIDTMEFGHMFNQSLANIKFSNLRMLTVNNNHVLQTFKFPPLLEIIRFYPGFSTLLSDITLPDTIKIIYFSEQSAITFADFNKIIFPKSLIKLVLPRKHVRILDIEKLIADTQTSFIWTNSIIWPDTLEELSIGHAAEKINNLPPSLKKLFIHNTKTNVCHFQKLPFGCKLYDVNTNNVLD